MEILRKFSDSFLWHLMYFAGSAATVITIIYVMAYFLSPLPSFSGQVTLTNDQAGEIVRSGGNAILRVFIMVPYIILALAIYEFIRILVVKQNFQIFQPFLRLLRNSLITLYPIFLLVICLYKGINSLHHYGDVRMAAGEILYGSLVISFICSLLTTFVRIFMYYIIRLKRVPRDKGASE